MTESEYRSLPERIDVTQTATASLHFFDRADDDFAEHFNREGFALLRDALSPEQVRAEVIGNAARMDDWLPPLPDETPRVLTRAEAVRLGYSANAIEHRLAARRWQRLHNGV